VLTVADRFRIGVARSLLVEQNTQLSFGAPQYPASTKGPPTRCEYDRKFVGRRLGSFNSKLRAVFRYVENYTITHWFSIVGGHFRGDLNGPAYKPALIEAHRTYPCRNWSRDRQSIRATVHTCPGATSLPQHFAIFLRETLRWGCYVQANSAVRRNPHADDCRTAAFEDIGSRPSAVRTMRAKSGPRFGRVKSNTPGSSRPWWTMATRRCWRNCAPARRCCSRPPSDRATKIISTAVAPAECQYF
jgi:hypothetical protein